MTDTIFGHAKEKFCSVHGARGDQCPARLASCQPLCGCEGCCHKTAAPLWTAVGRLKPYRARRGHTMLSRAGGCLRKVTSHVISRKIQSLNAPASVTAGMDMAKSTSMARPQVSSLPCTLMWRISRQKATNLSRIETRLLHTKFSRPRPMHHTNNCAIESLDLLSRWSSKRCPWDAPFPGGARQRRWQSRWRGEKEGWEWQHPFGHKARLHGLVASVCAAAGVSAHVQIQGASMSEAAATEIVSGSAEGNRAATPYHVATSSDTSLTKR